ncbi:MAG: methyl-accepting chemotaxis protein [Pseudomonadota bacterium]
MKILANCSIAARLGAAFTILIVVSVVSTACALVCARNNVSAVEQMMQEPLAKERIAGDWYAHVYAAVMRTSMIARSSDGQLAAAFADDIRLDAEQGTALGQQMGRLLRGDEEQAIYGTAMARRAAYLDAKNRILAARKDGAMALAGQTFQLQFLPASQAYLAQMRALRQLERTTIDRMRADIRLATERGARLVLVLSALTVLLAAVFAWLAARSVTVPLTAALAAAHAVAAGDLGARAVPVRRDEIGSLLCALDVMRCELVRMVREVQGGAQSVAAVSAQIADGNADLSRRTAEQAVALEQTAASVEQLAASVGGTAASAAQANRFALGASATTARGSVVVGEVVERMGRIEHSSRRIAAIVDVIEGIAFQTNLLALNAAVEAARAGEQGKGFAVVAAEVRGLAQRAAGAGRQINQLIAESSDHVAAGSRLVASAGTAMDEVVDHMGRLTEMIGVITLSSQQQSAAIAQINQAVLQIDQATQGNAACADDALEKTATLQRRADKMSRLVSAFRLGVEAPAGVPRQARDGSARPVLA